MRRVLIHLVCAALAAGCLVPAVFAVGDADGDARWRPVIEKLQRKLGAGFTVKRVGMFVVAHDLDEAAGERCEELIAQLEAALYKQFFATRPGYIIRIAVFRNNASLRKHARKLAEKSLVMPGGGFYLGYEKVLCVDAAMGEWLLKHELTHALLHADFRRDKVTPWLDEGMASLVESAKLEGGEIHFQLDRRLALVHKLMKQQKLPHIKDVAKMDFRTYNSRRNRMVGDAVARNVLFYLHEKGLLVRFYRRFRNNYSKDRSGVTFIEQLLKKDIDAVEADWLAWVNDKVAKRGKPPAGGESPTTTK